MTDRIRDFLATRRPEGPCLVVDLDVVRENYSAFAKALPDSRVFYAVKANPEPEVLKLLAELGSSFDCASVAEIDMALAAGATPDRISYGNTIKKERDIAAAFARGIRLFAVDCRRGGREDRPRRARRPVFCRILCANDGAEWPLSRKFGCAPEHGHRRARARPPRSASTPMASPSMSARSSRTRRPGTLRSRRPSQVFRTLSERGIQLRMVNLGGGFPAKYLKKMPAVKTYGRAILDALRKHFGNRIPETIIEPGRGMVGDAGVIKAEVVLISKKAADEETALGLSRHRQVRRPRRDHGRGDPLSDPHRP